MSALRRAIALAAALGAVVTSAPALAQTAPTEPSAEAVGDSLNAVRTFYRDTDFAGCARSARELLDRGGTAPELDTDAIDELRTYLAACLIRAGDVQAGDAAFEAGIRAALKENRLFKDPSPLVFPEAVIQRYDAMNLKLQEERKRLSDEKWKARQKEEAERRRALVLEVERTWALYDLASQERVTLRNRRWVAAVPFGVGQFQNGERTLGALFLTAETLALVGVIAGLSWQLELDARYRINQKDAESPESATRRRDTANTLWVASLYSLVGLAALGVLEAELRFVPERTEVRQRPLPDALRPRQPRPSRATGLTPLLFPARGGAVFGLAGRF